MSRLVRHLPAQAAMAAMGLLLFLFIALPLGMVLFESLRLAGPIPLPELARITEQALDRLDPEERRQLMGRWLASLKPEERTAGLAGSFELLGRRAPWDTRAAFDDQARAAEAAVAALSATDRRRLEG
ncbi:MAG TPA: hypothetical protein PLU25_17620, partial [Acidobacteriota bacterium]|nr:hypothetical protein [Acidobacteriota bacterium]